MNYLDKAIEIIKKIESLGYQAYIVGGAVRDYLLNQEIYDIDLTTNMPLKEIKNYFNVFENGEAYLSVTIIEFQYSFEITHFRKDISYSNHRHPQTIEVETLEEDVVRRDYTINALAMDSNYNIIDYVGGQIDLKKGIIRLVGDFTKRYEEDCLRILRGLYLASKLNFEIDKDTLKEMMKYKHLLSGLSHMRLYEYFKKILYSNTSRGIFYIHKYDLFSHIEEYKKLLFCVNSENKEKYLGFYYYLKYNEFLSVMSNEQKKHIVVIKDVINNNFDNYSLYLHKEIILDNLDFFKELSYDINFIKNKISELKIQSNSQLAITQSEISLMFRGKMISIAINEVVKAILEGRIENNKKDILYFLKRMDVVEC